MTSLRQILIDVFYMPSLLRVVHFSISAGLFDLIGGLPECVALSARARQRAFAVLDWINGLDAETIVPGHGPLGTKKRISQMRECVDILKRGAKKRFDASISAIEATVDIRRDL
jgi:hypothetical protein